MAEFSTDVLRCSLAFSSVELKLTKSRPSSSWWDNFNYHNNLLDVFIVVHVNNEPIFVFGTIPRIN